MEDESKKSSEKTGIESDFQNDEIDARRNDLQKSKSYLLEDTDYKTDHAKRGKAIIFNHKFFEDGFGLRKGTDADVESLTKALLKLGFSETDIKVFNDLRFFEISSELQKVKEEDHTDSDLLMVFVLTHGNRNDEISAFDMMYSCEKLWHPFTADKCKTLAGKPKIFFITACRGDYVDIGFEFQPPETEVDAKPTSCDSYKIPVWSDFLYIFSTNKGYYSYRHEREGTWYIQTFCDEVSRTNFDKVSFTDFLTTVNRRIASMDGISGSFDPVKQTPIVSSTLRKNLYLRNKNDNIF